MGGFRQHPGGIPESEGAHRSARLASPPFSIDPFRSIPRLQPRPTRSAALWHTCALASNRKAYVSLPTPYRSLPLRLALGCALAAPTPAQETVQPRNYSGIASQYVWNTTLGTTGPFKNVIAGRFTQDPLPDLVVHKGSELVYLKDPGQQYFYQTFGGATLDAVLWPGDQRDAIVACELGQITLYEWDDTGLIGPPRPFASLPSASEIDLEVDPVGGASFLGLLEVDGSTITYGEIQPQGCVGVCFSQVLRLDLAENVLSWQLIQWDGIAGLELIVHTPTQVRVIDAAGLDVVEPVSAQDVTSIFGRYFDPELGADRGYWYTEVAPDFFGILYDNRYPTLEPATAFGTLEMGRFGFADYNGDDLLDVWFPTVTTGEAIVLYGQSQPSFPVDQTFGLDLQKSTLFPVIGNPEIDVPPTRASIGDTGDFDFDGDLDFFFVSDDYEHLNFVRGDVRDEDLYGPSLRNYSFELVAPGEGDGGVEYNFTLEVGIPYPVHPRLPGGQSVLRKLEIAIHVQPDPTGPVQPHPRFVQIHDLPPTVFPIDRDPLGRPGSGPTQLGEYEVGDFEAPGNTYPGLGPSELVPLDFPLFNDPGGAVYQFRFRLLGGSGNQIGPAHVQYFANDMQTQAFLEGQYDPWGDISLLDPENGFGFHRRGGLGGFCATCP